MTDTELAETIARVRADVAFARDLHTDTMRVGLDLLTRLLDAAEAGMRAADALRDMTTIKIKDARQRADEVAGLLREARAQARDAALEEVAVVCDAADIPLIAAVIRAMKGAA